MKALLALVAITATAAAQPGITTRDPAAVLRAADAEGAAGDWARAAAEVRASHLAPARRERLAVQLETDAWQ